MSGIRERADRRGEDDVPQQSTVGFDVVAGRVAAWAWDDDDRRKSSPQRVTGRENDRPVRPLNLLHNLIEKTFEVVLIRKRECSWGRGDRSAVVGAAAPGRGVAHTMSATSAKYAARLAARQARAREAGVRPVQGVYHLAAESFVAVRRT